MEEKKELLKLKSSVDAGTQEYSLSADKFQLEIRQFSDSEIGKVPSTPSSGNKKILINCKKLLEKSGNKLPSPACDLLPVCRDPGYFFQTSSYGIRIQISDKNSAFNASENAFYLKNVTKKRQQATLAGTILYLIAFFIYLSVSKQPLLQGCKYY